MSVNWNFSDGFSITKLKKAGTDLLNYMNRIFIITLLISVLAVSAFAQNKNLIVSKTLDVNSLPGTIKDFIPKGFEPLYAASGNLNLDSIPDVILVAKKPDEKETSNVVDNPAERPLLILIGEGKGYRLAARNDEVVLCVDCGGVFGDPFDGISIKNGVFSVEHYGGSSWRWTKIITFKYSPKDKNWLLTRVGSDSFHASEPEKVKTEVKTAKNFGKILFEKYDGF